ncbi:tetratricopeptide repeat protein [Anaeromyxobacter soli]|uniref:tetratricopeptide repeat protein n=1 Tax=Anaeromyxobacter soli TaxID=2922725 RepID=UPI001FAF8ED6|nr:tetratricopeptide repeat protein [Anaeromyxobacter sp. SG29]
MTSRHAEPLLDHADALLSVGRHAEAERLARDALGAAPESERGHGLLARALGGQGRFDEGVAAVEAGLSLHPTSEWLHRVRALALWQAGRHEAALAAAGAALRLDPRSPGGHHVRSMALLALRRIREARAAAEEAVMLAPEVHEYRAHLGDTWLKESPATAEAHYRASLTLDPERPLTLNNLGVALMKLRRLDEAAQAFKAALAIDPGLRQAKLNAFAVSNPVMRSRWVAWLGLAVGVGVAGLTWHRLHSNSEASWTLWGAVGLAATYLVAMSWVVRSGLRRLAAVDLETHALRGRVAADLRADRIAGGPWTRRLGAGLAAFGALTLAASLVLEVMVVRQWLAFPSEPRRTSLEEARPGEWVALRDAALLCDSRREVRAGTFYAGLSTGGRPFLASYADPVDCSVAQAGLRGVLIELVPRLAATLDDAGFPVPAGDPPRLCTECGPSESRLFVVVLLGFAAIAAFLLREGLKQWRRGRAASSA